jgi:glycosyltransferase involved in cell wall biosynthesis
MHSHRPQVSIVIPFFGRGPEHLALLDETLGTVDQQTFTDFEVIVVDDGSPIDVADVVATHPRTRLHRQANAGSAVARNAGIASSCGDQLVFLDADDHLLPDALAAGVAHLAAHSEAGFVVGPREEMTYEGEPVSWSVEPPPEQTDLYIPLLRFDWYIIPPSSAMFRRPVLDTVGGFRDPWGADDLDFYLRAARSHKAWCFQAPAVTRYRRYSASSSRDGERMLRSTRAVYARQEHLVKQDPDARAAWQCGLRRLTDIFIDCLEENVRDRLRFHDLAGAFRSARMLASERPDRWNALRTELGWPPDGLPEGP